MRISSLLRFLTPAISRVWAGSERQAPVLYQAFGDSERSRGVHQTSRERGLLLAVIQKGNCRVFPNLNERIPSVCIISTERSSAQSDRALTVLCKEQTLQSMIAHRGIVMSKLLAIPVGY
ncbi:hypothetical protein BDY19DRAFT_299474 [Irpex rosettiformis]|uniref:Uncharacterized protein n=1 Tax=Irpex rosettiformis TaxID=378272 RepID=A0ACB8TYF3_9APHY|nr:hypothetical protein BDY19DRAFT_299474 [Irpex rosettiformis]